MRIKLPLLIKAMLIVSAFLLIVRGPAEAASDKKCFHVASFDEEWAWSGKVDLEMRKSLNGKCSVQTLYLDARKNPSNEAVFKKLAEAKEQFEKTKPDVTLVSGDRAVRDFLLNYGKASKRPFVFVATSVEPEEIKGVLNHATGILRAVPIESLIAELNKSLPKKLKTVAWIGVDTEFEHKEFAPLGKRFKGLDLKVEEYWVKSLDDWKRMFSEAQEQDLVYLGNAESLSRWGESDFKEWLKENQKKPSVSHFKEMALASTLWLDVSPESQGALAAEQTKLILIGKDPKAIPVTTNKTYRIHADEEKLELLKLKLSEGLKRRAPVKKLTGESDVSRD